MNRRLLKHLLRSLPAAAIVLAFPFASSPALAAGIPSASTGTVVRSATEDQTSEPGLSIQIDAESAAVEAGEPLRLTVTVDNTTGADIVPGQLVLTGGTSTIGSRAPLHAHLDGSDPLPTPTTLVALPIPSVAADTSYTSETIAVPHEALTMPADYGAVPLTATLTSGSFTIAAHDTYIAAAAPPTTTIELSISMPVTAPTGQNGLISADSLATYTAPGGVLARQLDGAAGRDVALAVDPMIIASIRALGTAAPATATAWLDRLTALSNETFALQFADADGAVQAAAGLDPLLGPASLDFAIPGDFTAVAPTTTPGNDPTGAPATDEPSNDEPPTTEALTEFDWSMDGMLWPTEGTVSTDSLDVFANSGVEETILSSANLADSATPPAASVADGHDVLVADDAVSAGLRAAATAVTASDFADAVASVSAELAVSAREQAATGRAILATLDRGWPPTASRLGEALDAVAGLPTVTPTTLSSVRAEERTEVTLADVQPDTSRTGAVSLLVDREKQLGQFSSVLVQPELLTGRERVQILSLLSVDWNRSADDWTAALVAHSQQTTDLLGSVSILNSSDVLLVGNESAIPFGVRNDSPYDVRVLVDAVPSNIRLDVGASQAVDVAAGSRQTVRIPVKAQLGNGDVGITVSLSSASGVPIGQPVTATVAVRADWEGIGAVIAVLIVVAMLVAGIVRTVLRRRARITERDAARRAADADGDAPDETANENENETETDQDDADDTSRTTTDAATDTTTSTEERP